jgi:isopenicillin N synthase-like dioxygenase
MHFFKNTWIQEEVENNENGNFKPILTLYYKEMYRITLILLRILEIGLNLPEKFFTGNNLYYSNISI